MLNFTYISASTSSSRGAVQPKISPGDKGLERGIVAWYLPFENPG